MKMNKNLSALFSKQIVGEYYSAYLYLSMSAYCDKLGFKGFANWMHIQAQEELAHGTRLYQYLLERNEAPKLTEIMEPPHEFKGLVDVLEKTLQHEKLVTESINEIATMAMEEKDHAAYIFIQWYVTEQVEEEASADEILQKLILIGENTTNLYSLDAEMASRVFTDPFAQ